MVYQPTMCFTHRHSKHRSLSHESHNCYLHPIGMQTKQELIDKIAALNASIDDVTAKLKKDEVIKEAA